VFEKEPFQLNNPRQIRIYEKLLSVGKAPAALYLDVCKFAKAGNYFQGRVHYIAHAFREIEGLLIESIIDWQTKGQIDSSKSKEKYREKIKACLRILEVSETDPFAEVWLNLRKGKFKLERLAHRNSLVSVRRLDSEFHVIIDRFENFLDSLLQKYNNLFPQFMQRIDTIISKARPTNEDVKVLRNNVPTPVLFGYFFKRLDNPKFLKPLRKGGFFKTPTFAEARWLSIIAENASEDESLIIYRIISETSTDDCFVIKELIGTATRLPIELSSKIAEEKINSWMHVQNARFFVVDLAQWISILIKREGFPNHYMLAESILELIPVRKRGERHALPRWHRGGDQQSSVWYYRQVIKNLSVSSKSIEKHSPPLRPTYESNSD